jgi:ketosteroid isomerase-like protein
LHISIQVGEVKASPAFLKIILMKTERESIIRNFFTPHDLQDVSDFYKQFAENIVIYVPKHFPWGGCYYGLRGAGDMLSNVSRHILADIEVEEIFCSGGQVVSIGGYKARPWRPGSRLAHEWCMCLLLTERERLGGWNFMGRYQTVKLR